MQLSTTHEIFIASAEITEILNIIEKSFSKDFLGKDILIIIRIVLIITLI